MVYRLNASLIFPSAAARNTAVAAITGSVATTVRNQPALSVTRQDPSAIPMNTAYTAVVSAANTNGALDGSYAVWHACYHGDLAQVCAVTGRTDW